jgi:hypothetical protein
VKLSAMFLRTGCILPDGMELTQRRFGEKWMSVENATAATLDARVRNAGWHFMCLQTAHSRLGIGRTAESATSKAMALALNQTEGRFNAAELVWSRLRNVWDFTLQEQRFIPARSSSMLRLAWSMKWFSVSSQRSKPSSYSGIKSRLQYTPCIRHEPFT